MTSDTPQAADERNGPPFTVDRYGSFGECVIAERDYYLAELASWKAVAHDHSERLKVIGIHYAAAVQDVDRLSVAIRAYVAARLHSRGELAAHWWTLQSIAKEFTP